MTTPSQPPLPPQPAPQLRKRGYLRVFLILIGIVGGSASPTPAQEAQAKQQVSDVTVIPGTRWVAQIVTNSDGFRFCIIHVTEEDGERVMFTVGDRGSLALQIEDEYLEKQISSVLPWLEPGESYRAVLFLDDKKFNVSAIRIAEHGLLIKLKSIDSKTLFQTKRIGLAVAAIAMRGYKVEGLDIAIPELQDCARQLRKAKR